ncbi:MAG: response regulator [Myxococcales bacterium]|nr:response regulator [Myxococcales bacterium]
MTIGSNPTIRVLAVDDSPTVRSVVILAFTGAPGYAVRVEADSMLGLRESERASADGKPYDCFLLDIEMEPFDGFELARRLRVRPAYARTPIIFLTSSEDPALRDRAAVFGAGFLAKSSITVLRASLREVVDEWTRPSKPPPAGGEWGRR